MLVMRDDSLRVGVLSENAQVNIVFQDKLCYEVESCSKGAYGIEL